LGAIDCFLEKKIKGLVFGGFGQIKNLIWENFWRKFDYGAKIFLSKKYFFWQENISMGNRVEWRKGDEGW
jgi:hypothetical protein